MQGERDGQWKWKGENMSFTMILLLVYLIWGIGAFIAFRRKHKAFGMGLLLVMALGILILGYMWIHSPM